MVLYQHPRLPHQPELPHIAHPSAGRPLLEFTWFHAVGICVRERTPWLFLNEVVGIVWVCFLGLVCKLTPWTGTPQINSASIKKRTLCVCVLEHGV